jgi:hypothetical protein
MNKKLTAKTILREFLLCLEKEKIPDDTRFEELSIPRGMKMAATNGLGKLNARYLRTYDIVNARMLNRFDVIIKTEKSGMLNVAYNFVARFIDELEIPLAEFREKYCATAAKKIAKAIRKYGKK